MISQYKHHLNRINSALDPASQAATIAEWVIKHTTIGGKQFSFFNHEYQRTILDDPAPIKYVKKCSQVGISELAVRRVIAKVMLHAEINAMYVLPSAAFSSMFSSTRLASALDSSKIAKESLYRTDSASVKRFFNESFIYMRGASKSGQAISVPVSDITLDEINFMEDQSVLTSFTSRMTHAAEDVMSQLYFSTPTVPGYAVSHLFENSMQHFEMQRCCHCNHTFIADYYEHVKLPGFNVRDSRLKGPAGLAKTNRKLTEINFLTKNLLTQFPVNEAYLECPACRGKVDQDIQYREFVVKNPDSNFEEHGYQITPFAAPFHMPPPKMIKTSVSYSARKDFVNNTLGLDHEDKTTGLGKEELDALFTSDIQYPDSPPFQISGTDMGGSCAHMTAYSAPDGHLRIMSAELIPLHKFKVDYPKSLAEHNIISSVIDLMPYTDLVATMQAKVPTLFACLFSKTKGVELYNIREQEEDETKASYGIRQVTAKKHALFDFLVDMIRTGKISFAPSTFGEKEKIIEHMRDMKRMEITNADGDKEFIWVKSATGEDHYMHALGYLVLADFLKGLSTASVTLPNLISKFRQKKVL